MAFCREKNQKLLFKVDSGVKTYVLLLKNYAKKTIVLTPQRP